MNSVDILSPEQFLPVFEAQLRVRPWLLWVGSAISANEPSAIPLVPAIVEAILDELAAGVQGSAAPLARRCRTELGWGGPLYILRDMPFEAILGEVMGHTGEFVPNLLRQLNAPAGDTIPNVNHHMVAALLGHHVDLVVTTNFDECLEPALHSRGITSQPLVPVRGRFRVNDERLLKLHGTVSEWSSVGATMHTLADRTADPGWSSSLADLLAGRNVLFVGYGFHDVFDITPALIAAQKRGAQYHWADRQFRDLPGLKISHRIANRLENSSPQENILAALIAMTGQGPNPMGLQDGSLDDDLQGQRASLACRIAAAGARLSSAQRLKAFAALYYWIEEGARALQLFQMARDEDMSLVDSHAMARAYMRARRYRKAVAQFEQMLREELPDDEQQRVLSAIDWHCGAAHCAASGGRVGLAERHYRHAEGILRGAGCKAEELPPYLADQFLRGRAENQVRLASGSWTRKSRDLHLGQAENFLDRLGAVGGVELNIRPLIELDRARIALVRGQSLEAEKRAETARGFFASYGDPDALTVVNRILALTQKNREPRVLAGDARNARHHGRWLEWAKIQATRLGLGGHSRTAPMQFALRNIMIRSKDFFQELIRLRNR